MSKLYFIDSSSTTYFFNDPDSSKKDDIDVYIAQDGSEIYPFMKVGGCTVLLNELSKENLLVRPKGSSLDTTEACSSWIAINKRILSHDEFIFLNSLP